MTAPTSTPTSLATSADDSDEAADQRRLRAVEGAAAYVAEWLAFQGDHRAVPGIQAAIRYRGELILDLAWGVADVESGEPLTSEHLFRIASHSKVFTATAVMQLAERGALRLDDTVADWIPELADSALAAVTLREMLAHQSGIVRDGLDADYWQRGAEFPERARLVEICLAEGKVYERNEYFKYSNIAYSLLGVVIEAASGQTYGEYTHDNIAVPLSLTRSGSEWTAERASEYAAGHTAKFAASDVRRRIPHVDTHAMAAATGWYSTAREVTAFLAAHAIGQATLVSDDSKRQMRQHASVVEVAGVKRNYGLGLDLRELEGHDLIGHSGGYPGHITRTWLDPETDVVVSVLTNAIDGPADVLATGALGIIRLALENADADTRADRIQGRYASLWSVLDLVDLGGTTFALHPTLPDPAALAEPVVVGEDGEIRQLSKASYGASGEPVEVTREDSGAVKSLRWSGMSMWPYETFTDVMTTPEPGAVLEGMAL